MTEDEKKMAEYLAGGGKVTKCPPGPSEGIVYRRGTFARRRPEEKPAPAPQAEPAPPPQSE